MRKVSGGHALDKNYIIPGKTVLIDKNVADVCVIMPKRSYMNVKFPLPVLNPKNHFFVSKALQLSLVCLNAGRAFPIPP
jgi:hypothetical protein